MVYSGAWEKLMKKPEVKNLGALSLKIHVRKVKRIDTTLDPIW
jgi:hypothetical protein